MFPKLTIVIPTFNRHSKLLNLLQIIDAVKDVYDVKILIIDNGSTPCVKGYLQKHYTDDLEKLTIYRNEANIGAGANILLAHIQAQTEWTWLLGDDDLPFENCFETIFRDISMAKESDFLIKYNSTAGHWPSIEQTISNEMEFVSFCDNFMFYSNILFISNSVFRTNKMKNYAHLMMNFSQTMCPWIIGYLKNLENGNTIQIKMDYIIENGIADTNDSWNYHNLREGMFSFIDVNGLQLFKQIMLPNLLLFYFDAKKRFLIRMFKYAFYYKQFSVEYWVWFYKRCSLCFSGRRRQYLLLISYIIPLCYDIKFLNKLITNKVSEKTVIENGRS